MKITDLKEDEYASFYNYCLPLVDNNWTLTEELEISLHNFIRFVQDIPMGKHDYRYAKDKWTIKEIIQHLIDSERVFAYRALRFSRGDSTELPGYDQNMYVENSRANERGLQSLLTELSSLRHNTLLMFKSFTKEDLLRTGIASGNRTSVRALGFIIIGHQNHHMKIFKERYLD